MSLTQNCRPWRRRRLLTGFVAAIVLSWSCASSFGSNVQPRDYSAQSNIKFSGFPFNVLNSQMIINNNIPSTNPITQILTHKKALLEKNSYVHIPAEEMENILRMLGSTASSVEAFSTAWEIADDNQDPTYSFKNTRVGRVVMDKSIPVFNSEVLPEKPFVLSAADVSDETIIGVSRRFAQLPRSWPSNPTALAFYQFMFALLNNHDTALTHPDHKIESSKYVIDQFCDRVTKRAGPAGEGECPSPEGIHQDGNDYTVMVYMGSDNVNKDKPAYSRLWNVSQKNGLYNEEDFEAMKKNLLFNHPMEKRFETIAVRDRYLKHEGTAFTLEDPLKPATRDMFLMFVRRPMKDGSDNEDTIVPGMGHRGTEDFSKVYSTSNCSSC